VNSPKELERAYRYCLWLTAHHYENFPVASRLLPATVRPHVAAIYAFARSADDFADDLRYHGRSLDLLNGWRAALQACPLSTPKGAGPEGGQRGQAPVDRLAGHPIFVALAQTIREKGLPPQLLDDLLTAFILDVTKKRYADWEELMHYCRHSANPVGRLVLLLFGVREPELHELSDRICTGLQLANHWQDLSLDWARDMLYLPADRMRAHGVSEQSLTEMLRDRRGSPEFRKLMKEMTQRAAELFDRGAPLCRRVSGRLRWELKLTLAGGRAILKKIKGSGWDPFARRPVLSGPEKGVLLVRSLLPGG